MRPESMNHLFFLLGADLCSPLWGKPDRCSKTFWVLSNLVFS